ncbi:hypothetical protein [Carnobacterium sp. FSL E2-0243]|uniref:hypothetical protein n=1 Tax=Carnobacterium sp. FSL E2-0243 TaxID=2921365 RepID=UPI0030F4BD44
MIKERRHRMILQLLDEKNAVKVSDLVETRAFDTYESKKHPESPRGLIFFAKFIGCILRDLA